MKTNNSCVLRMAGMYFLAVLLGMVSFTGCTKPEPTKIGDPFAPSRPRPMLQGISSSHGSTMFAGVSYDTIKGVNFSDSISYNFVYFDLNRAVVVKASQTQLVVKVPNYIKDTVWVFVAVKGADKYSDSIRVKLSAAVAEFGGYKTGEESVGLAGDTAGSIYSSTVSPAALPIGIRRIFSVPGLPDTSKELYGLPIAGFKQYQNMKMGPGNVLYALRIPRVLYTLATKGTAPTLWLNVLGTTLFDFDFSKSGGEYYIWAGGNDTALYRIKVSDKSVQSYSFTGMVRSVRVYNNNLYVAAKVDSTEGVWQFPITGTNDLGAGTLYFNLSAKPGYGYNGPEADAITFSANGDMYLGTSGADAILVVHSATSFEPLYPGLLLPTPISFAWGRTQEPYLFYSRGGDASHVIIKINTQQKSAPYYGRGD